MAYQLRVLGSPELQDGDGRPVSLSLGKPLALLIYVACQPSPVSRDDLAALLWPDTDRQKGRHSVRQALWVIRNAVGEDLFEDHEPLALKEGVVALDLQQFNEALADGRVEEARALWRGPLADHFLLAGVRHWDLWTDELRTDLEHRFSKALLQQAELLPERGEAEEAVSILNQAIEVTPSSEAAHIARIELLLDLLRLAAAREALSDAHRSLGDLPTVSNRLSLLEERLEGIIRDQRARTAEGESFPLEFVGRSRELAGLHKLWRDADLGRSRVAVITGPSGIGKTRLAQELLSYVAGSGIQSVAVKGSRGGMKLRWGITSDLVRQLLRLPGSAGISSASDSLLRAMLPSMGRGAIDLQTVNGVSPAAVLDAVSDLLESVTFETPLLVMADDFQWMDQDSQTLLMGLAHRSREIRALLLILGRSDLSSRHWEGLETSLVEESGAQRFVLKPLIEEEVGELLALGAAFLRPEEAPFVVRKIYQASAGNPLFIREILRVLGEKGVVRREGPGWVFRTSEVPEELDLPENIQLLLQERLNRLSEAAANLAATLAGENRTTSSETLQRKTRLPSGVYTQAVAELLERGVIEWVEGTFLDFVHDQLRDAAATHLAGSLPEPVRGSGWFSRNWGILALAAILIMVLPLAVLWGRGVLPWQQEPTPPPYGGGIILLQRGLNPPRALRILEETVSEWERVELDPPPPPGIRRTFRAPGGGFVWFGVDETPEGPNLVRITLEGDRIPFFPEPGDQSILDQSPEGNRYLFSSENVGSERFSHSLFWAEDWPFEDRPSPTKHLIFEGFGPIGLGRWSNDGDMVAFNIVAASDSLAVYSIAGERLWTRAFGEIHALEWCGEGIVVAAAPEEEIFLFKVDLTGEEVTPIAPLALGRVMACSPDGRALLQIEVVDEKLAFILRDLESGEVHRFPAWDVHDANPFWIPDAVSTTPLRVVADQDTIRMEWGETRVPAASLISSDFSETSEGIWWEALDPDIANFNPDQELTGNQAGATQVLARWGHSLRDTVVVIVEDNGSGGPAAFLTERWEVLDTTRWIPFGSHPPVVREIDGEGVLQLLGDEKYADGLMLRAPIPVDQGVTIELEFRTEINRDVHQNLGLCLRDMDPSTLDRESGGYYGTGEVLCILYPSREFEKMDPSEISFRVSPGVESRVRVPGILPSSGWTHIAIQVRPDGEPSLVVDRTRVATSPIHLSTAPQHQWTIAVDGDAVGTEVFVRNLNIWREIRY